MIAAAAPAAPSAEEPSPEIRLNTIGFLPQAEKKASIAGACAEFAVVRTKDGAKVVEGKVAGPIADAETGDPIRIADFSAFREPGEYRLDVPGVSRSASGEVVERLWDFGHGIPEVTAAPMHSFDRPGKFRVTLIVWDAEGRGARAERVIEVLPAARGD